MLLVHSDALYPRERIPGVQANNKNIEESYTKIPKSAILNELKENSIKEWQSEWENTTKGETTKFFFPKVEDRLKIRINTIPKLTTITTGHGNIKSYLYLLTYLLTPWCRVLLEKLTGLQLVKKLPAFHGT